MPGSAGVVVGRPPAVSVVIATMGGPHLDRCLDALAGQHGVDFEVIVVDAGGRGEVEHRVRRRFPEATVVPLARNLGFAGSNNAGLARARGRWIATLNDDAYPEPGWLTELLRVGEIDHGVGAVASLMVWSDRPEVVNSAGVAVNLAGVAWDRLGGLPAGEVEREPVDVFGACAGAALYRRAALAAVGPFDESFFAYLEDVDLAWRLRWGGWRTRFAPAARVLHQGSQTSDRFPRRKEWLLSRNRIYLLARNYPVVPWLWPLVVGYDLLSVPWWRIRYQRDFTPLLGRLAGLARLPRLLRSRRRQPRRVARFESLRVLMAPLPTPWAFARGAR